MKIFFYANINKYDKSIGISKKVTDQIHALRNMNHEVFYTTYTENGVQILNNYEQVVMQKEYKIPSKIFRVFRRDILIKNTCRFLKMQGDDFNVCYVRFHYFDRRFNNMLRIMKNHAKVVIEAHGYPYREWTRSLLYTFINIRDVLYESSGRKYIDLVAAISNRENIWGRKTIFIDNAIDINSIKLHNRKPEENILNLISIAIEQPYHGYEKVIRGLDNYYKNGGTRKISIFMVGEYSKKTKELVHALKLNQFIFFTGKLYGKQLEDMYDKADLAVGTFSKRANDEYGSSIKTKEFFAKGIPFINGWREYTFDDSCPYMKRFDMGDTYIDFNRVVSFYDSIKDNKNISTEMRKFAKEHFVWEKQFEKVFYEV